MEIAGWTFGVQCCCRNAGKQIEEEDEDDGDVFITNSAYSVLNIVCPVSGKPVVELVDPVRRLQFFLFSHL